MGRVSPCRGGLVFLAEVCSAVGAIVVVAGGSSGLIREVGKAGVGWSLFRLMGVVHDGAGGLSAGNCREC